MHRRQQTQLAANASQMAANAIHGPTDMGLSGNVVESFRHLVGTSLAAHDHSMIAVI
jgi:hypothetical protein